MLLLAIYKIVFYAVCGWLKLLWFCFAKECMATRRDIIAMVLMVVILLWFHLFLNPLNPLQVFRGII